MNKHEVAPLHLLPMLSRYRRMSESVHHDERCSTLHCRKCFRYDDQRSSLNTEGLNRLLLLTRLWERRRRFRSSNLLVDFPPASVKYE